MQSINILSGSIGGLNTVADPIRLPFDPETGMSDLAVAVNVRIDETGFISRREGFTLVNALVGAHSIFCDGGICLVVAESVLCQVMPNLPDLSVVSVLNLNSNNRMAYCQVNDDIYFTNGVDLGIVNADGVSRSWEAVDYVGPDSNRHFDGPRPGNHLAFFSGRIFVSDENVLWWSEPFSFSQFDRARNYILFSSKILMVKAVTSGLYVSDERSTYFSGGNNPKDFILAKVAAFPVPEWSEAIDYVDAVDVGMVEPGKCALWPSIEGACLGTPSGTLVNLNKKKVIYPERGTRGASLLQGYNFIHTIGV